MIFILNTNPYYCRRRNQRRVHRVCSRCIQYGHSTSSHGARENTRWKCSARDQVIIALSPCLTRFFIQSLMDLIILFFAWDFCRFCQHNLALSIDCQPPFLIRLFFITILHYLLIFSAVQKCTISYSCIVNLCSLIKLAINSLYYSWIAIKYSYYYSSHMEKVFGASSKIYLS